MSDFVFSHLLKHVRNPASYLGCEWGAVRKTLTNEVVRWVLAFPDSYEIGMSHFGLQVLYHILNLSPYAVAERVFTPKPEMQELLVQHNLPLCSLETHTPLSNFDVVGFSLPYELGYTNALRMLRLGRIAILAAKRKEDAPIVIAGGHCTVNPVPLMKFFDAFAIGEGEELVLEINEAIRRAKREKLSRRDKLQSLAGINGVYVPIVHGEGRSLVSIRAKKIEDLDKVPSPLNLVVPLTETAHDRAVVEVARGCPHSCRFCQAGFISKPYRERSPELVLSTAIEIIKNTGYQDITFLSLSAGDYCGLLNLVSALSSYFGHHAVAVNLPSLRVDSLNEGVIKQIKAMRKTGFTIAPEAGTERLRTVINKNITEEEILATARKVFENGWELIKLYFMFGLPTEREEDLRGIAELVQKIRREGLKAGVNPRLNVGLSAFVPKPHTPFQWEAMLNEHKIGERLKFLKCVLTQPGVQVKWSLPFMSVLEGVFARGDERLTGVLLKAEEMGAAFDAWGDSLQKDIWERAFLDIGVSIEEIACRERGLDEPLPWDNISTGVEKEWLKRERARAFKGERTYGCGNFPCADACGACDWSAVPDFKKDTLKLEEKFDREKLFRESFLRYRIVYSKTGLAQFIGHLDTVRIFQRSLRRSGIKLQYTEGFHPKPKLSFGEALQVGVESLCESIDVWVHESQTVLDIHQRLKENLPQGFEVREVRGISDSVSSSDGSARGVVFRFEGLPQEKIADIRARIERFLKEEKFVVERESKKGVQKADLKEAVKSIQMLDEGALEVVLCKTSDGVKIRPTDFYENLFGQMPDGARIIKIAVLT